MAKHTSKSIKQIFDSFIKLRVLIIGDVMIDNYVWGKVSRISPEAPVPIVSVVRKEQRLGGAANVALNVKALGATPVLCSVIGVDSAGKHFLEMMEKEKLSVKGFLKVEIELQQSKQGFLAIRVIYYGLMKKLILILPNTKPICFFKVSPTSSKHKKLMLLFLKITTKD